MTELMDAEETNELVVPAFSQAPNPFLSGHQCLLCRCERPHLPKFNGDVSSGKRPVSCPRIELIFLLRIKSLPHRRRIYPLSPFKSEMFLVRRFGIKLKMV